MVWERGKAQCVFRISFPDLCTLLSWRREQVPYELWFLQAGRYATKRRLFTFFIKREIRHFHVVVVQKRQRNVQKSVIHVQCWWFAY